MSFLLDTDICSAYLRNVSSVANRFLQYSGRLYLSVVTLAELEVWILQKRTPRRYKQALPVLLRDVVVLDVHRDIADLAGSVGADLRDQGLKMDTPDLLIAATALFHGLTLVTHNTQDYINVPGLALADWLVP